MIRVPLAAGAADIALITEVAELAHSAAPVQQLFTPAKYEACGWGALP